MEGTLEGAQRTADIVQGRPDTMKVLSQAGLSTGAALGSGTKAVEENEQKTVVLQRRCVRAARALTAGTVLSREDLEALLRKNNQQKQDQQKQQQKHLTR